MLTTQMSPPEINLIKSDSLKNQALQRLLVIQIVVVRYFIMEVTLKQAFSILDGRLSTKIEDVYEMLNYIFDENFTTHQLPGAMRKLNELNPQWFQNANSILNNVKRTNNTEDFEELIQLIDEGFPNYKIKLGKVDAKIDFLDDFV